MSMKAQVQLELQDYLDAQKLHFRQPNHIRFLSTLILAFLVKLFLVSESTYRKNYIYFFLILHRLVSSVERIEQRCSAIETEVRTLPH